MFNLRSSLDESARKGTFCSCLFWLRFVKSEVKDSSGKLRTSPYPDAPMAFTSLLAAAAYGLVVQTPTVQQYVVPAAAAVQPAANSILFPTSELLAGTSRITSFDDELEKIEAEQRAKDAAIDAKVRNSQIVCTVRDALLSATSATCA